QAVGDAWSHGADIDREALTGGAYARRVPLPGYPFARTRHWIDVRPHSPEAGQPAAVETDRFPVELSAHLDWMTSTAERLSGEHAA
ncbi:hypothetical protein G3M58_42070, partial [Streptomyces sp. SID7499]|nr:hypothetical protein [Streptomyces sp. SID7499]